MKTCVIDNKATMCREAWADGKLVAHISADQMMRKGFNGHRDMFFGLNVGPWESGKVRGEVTAMAEVQHG